MCRVAHPPRRGPGTGCPVFGPFFIGDANDENDQSNNERGANGRDATLSDLSRYGHDSGASDVGGHDGTDSAGQDVRDVSGDREI